MGETPPWWHQALDHFGLFAHYFASTLAIGLIAYKLWRLWTKGDPYTSVASRGLSLVGFAFLNLAIVSVVFTPGEALSFWFESSFIVVVLWLVFVQIREDGDMGVKIGMAFLALPLVVHYYGPFAFRFLSGGEDMFDLPERIQRFGQWTMVLAALATPYCFAPRPFMQSAARLAPLAVATFVSVIGIVIVRQHYEEGMRLAQQGLGVLIGPGAPSGYLALHLIALGTITWTLTSCLTADSVARRDIGVGLGLIVVGGYGFSWPLQYLVSIVGLMSISEASSRVVDEESAFVGPEIPVVSAPPIADKVWERYMEEVARALGFARKPGEPPPAMRDTLSGARPTVVTTRSGDYEMTTCLVFWRRDVRVALRVVRRIGSITGVEILCGKPGHGEPQWTLYARPEGLLGIGSHTEPPPTSAPAIRVRDRAFHERFRVRDSGGLTGKLLDEAMRARATALIDGWVAFWQDGGVRYRVEPGSGAPLDHPIPITEMAFRGARAEPSVERLVTVIDFLVDMARRGLNLGAPPESPSEPPSKTSGAAGADEA